MKRIELLRRNPIGAVDLTTAGGALLVGVEVEELLEVWDPARGAQSLPPKLQRKGHKRTRTARDATGQNDASSILGYWALITRPGCRLDYDEQAGQLWAVLDEPEGSR